ncbi:MAG TPA: CBS domain-containing protein [Saprospiraceae bacterium]|nr:CBS domain-containing protein [Saprospiraceae bacterium]
MNRSVNTMKPTTAIKDIMTTSMITVYPDDTIAIVRDKITSNQIHHVPVVQDGKVLGMISMNDIHKMEHHFTQFKNPEAQVSNSQIFASMLAKEIMSSPVVKVKQTEPVSVAVDLLLQNLFHALPVVDEKDELVGMITTFDLVRHSLDPK